MKLCCLSFSATLRSLAACGLLLLSTMNVFPQNRGQRLQYPTSGDPVPKTLLLQILRAEDERRWDNDLSSLFRARNARVRARAALAAGRIGNDSAVGELVKLLRGDDDNEVRAMAAFALGEIESPLGAEALTESLKESGAVRARAVEALGKITAALPKEQEARARELAGSVLGVLKFEARRRSRPDRFTMLLALTAVLRAKPEGAGEIVAEFLDYSDPRVRADAANTLARLKLKDGNDQLRKLLTTDRDPVVRANAARVLGATEDKESFEGLVDRAVKDTDSRVRVSAIRALAALKDQEPRVAGALASMWCVRNAIQRNLVVYHDRPQCLELVTALGRAFQGTDDQKVMGAMKGWSMDFPSPAPELEVALVRISPSTYLNNIGAGSPGKQKVQRMVLTNWHEASAVAQGLGEIAALPESTKDKKQLAERAQELLQAMLDYRNSGLTINTLVAVHSEYAIPDVLRAFAAFKPKELAEVLRKHLKESDVVVRGTAADLLGELPLDSTNTQALSDALKVALLDKDLNDAALSIIDALARQKNRNANLAIQLALDSPDYLVRRRAVTSLKATGAGDFSARIGTVQTRNTTADYERAIARIGKHVTATVNTTRGTFVIELLPEEATLNVDNFVQLASRRYFNGITVHRVVPNFVIQDGDPRGDGNGGPGYQIRCEINQASYDRAAVGMALSGKDTGGSQWFVTHSPQPHLDGGYTVFGNVTSGMNTVDNIARGDVIQSIVINETVGRSNRRR